MPYVDDELSGVINGTWKLNCNTDPRLRWLASINFRLNLYCLILNLIYREFYPFFKLLKSLWSWYWANKLACDYPFFSSKWDIFPSAYLILLTSKVLINLYLLTSIIYLTTCTLYHNPFFGFNCSGGFLGKFGKDILSPGTQPSGGRMGTSFVLS